MHSASAAEGDQHIVSGIVPALHRNHADRLLHDGISDRKNSFRKLLDGPERSAQLLHARPSAFPIQGKLTAEQSPLAKVAEHRMRVGYRWGFAASVADRTGFGAGAFRANA